MVKQTLGFNLSPFSIRTRRFLDILDSFIKREEHLILKLTLLDSFFDILFKFVIKCMPKLVHLLFH